MIHTLVKCQVQASKIHEFESLHRASPVHEWTTWMR